MNDVMRRILVWTEAEVTGLAATWGLSRVMTEIDERGVVTRELGIDVGGNVVHRFPGGPTRAKHGVFDLAIIPPSEETEIGLADFDSLWVA
jgi:hypothetical protein